LIFNNYGVEARLRCLCSKDVHQRVRCVCARFNGFLYIIHPCRWLSLKSVAGVAVYCSSTVFALFLLLSSSHVRRKKSRRTVHRQTTAGAKDRWLGGFAETRNSVLLIFDTPQVSLSGYLIYLHVSSGKTVIYIYIYTYLCLIIFKTV